MAIRTIEQTCRILRVAHWDLFTEVWSWYPVYTHPVSYDVGQGSWLAFQIAYDAGTVLQVDADYNWSYAVRGGEIYICADLPAQAEDIPNSALAQTAVPESQTPYNIDEHFSLTNISLLKDDYKFYIIFHVGAVKVGRTTSLLLHPPVATAQIDDTPPVDTAISPDGSDITFGNAVNFSWSFVYPQGMPLVSSQLQYSADNLTWIDFGSFSDATTSLTKASSYFGVGSFQWRVRSRTSFSEWGDWSAAKSFRVVPALSIANPAEPNGNVFRNRTKKITLQWTAINPDPSYIPDKSDLQWKTAGGQWTDLATVTGEARTYEVPANTFSHTEIFWRVRAYNSMDIPGDWSAEARFTTIDAEAVASINSPKTGASMNEKVPITLSWSVRNAYGNPPSKSQIQWSTQNDPTSYVDLALVTGSGTSYTVPADFFPGSAIYWRVRAYNQDETPGSWAYADFSTIDTPSIATPVSPIGTIENADAAIVFTWTSMSDSGSSPTGADVQIQNSLGEWEPLGTTDGTTMLVVPEDTISAGVVYWRVRSYNRNGTAGPWSDPVSFAAYAAPKIRAVFADSMPYATITWQVDGQLAFEVRVDGEVYGPYFGDGVRSYTLPEPLANGGHLAAVRAQNEYSLWSRWNEIPFTTASQVSEMLALTAEVDLDVLLTWTGGGVEPPVITIQPADMSTTDGLICFSVNASGTGLRYFWEMLLPGSAAWQEAPGGSQQIWTHAATEDYDGARFRCRVSNAAGGVISSAALYQYQDPSEAPVITIQPQDTKKRVGTVRLVCGATGSAYRWFRREAHSGDDDPDAIGISDGIGGVWRIPSGPGGALTIGVSDGAGGVWHMLSGAGETGAINVTDAAQRFWNFPSGRGIPDFVDTGVTSPTISFPASADRDGSLFYCMVSNSAGIAVSNICTYNFDDPDTPEQTGNYSVFRDGVLLDKAEYPQYTDRTALGVHSYQVTEHLPNNDVVRSNIVTVEVSVECLVIAPLDGGAWLKLKLSDREPRELRFTRSRQVEYIHYAGRKYPEAEVGEQEDLVGSFDASWPYEQEEDADAFEALIGKNVVIKTRRGIVVVGVLQGYERRDPRFYKSYSFQIRQDDWGGAVDA